MMLENSQSRCGDLHIRAIECIEYFGLRKGKVLCQDFHDDYVECKKFPLRVRMVTGYFSLTVTSTQCFFF